MKISRLQLLEFTLLSLAVVVSIFVRSLYLTRDYIFGYDQGRDALKVQEILHGDLSLIGPTTGLEGVFLGPFFYYFLAPFYFVTSGNAITVAYLFVILYTLTAFPLYYLGKRLGGPPVGALAVALFLLSFSQSLLARWVSNPTPLPFVTLTIFLLLLSVFKNHRPTHYFLIGILLGVAIQLEAANALFLSIVVYVLLILETRRSQLLSTLFLVSFGFAIPILPQALFELRHAFPTTKALLLSFTTKQVQDSFLLFFPQRLSVLYQYYASSIFYNQPLLFTPFAIASVVSLLLFGRHLWKENSNRVLLVWFFLPFFLHLFYRGNHGNFYDYYLIAQYPAFYLLVSLLITKLAFSRLHLIKLSGTLLCVALVVFAILANVPEWLAIPKEYGQRIAYSLRLDAIKWITQRTGSEPYGVWAYTPSYQDEVYKYAFWYAKTKGLKTPELHPEQTKRMYLILESDSTFLRRRAEWFRDKISIGKVTAAKSFGGIIAVEITRK